MYTYLKRPRAHVKDVRVRRIMETVKLNRARSKSVKSLPRDKSNTTRKKKKKKKKTRKKKEKGKKEEEEDKKEEEGEDRHKTQNVMRFLFKCFAILINALKIMICMI